MVGCLLLLWTGAAEMLRQFTKPPRVCGVNPCGFRAGLTDHAAPASCVTVRHYCTPTQQANTVRLTASLKQPG